MADEHDDDTPSVRVDTASLVIMDPCHFPDQEQLAQLVQSGRAVVVAVTADGSYPVRADEGDIVIECWANEPNDPPYVFQPAETRQALFLDR